MYAKEQLEKYIAAHPDYWEFENEMNEVTRLKALCLEEAPINLVLPSQSNVLLQMVY